MIGIAPSADRAQWCSVAFGTLRYVAASRSVNAARATRGSPSPMLRRSLVAVVVSESLEWP